MPESERGKVRDNMMVVMDNNDRIVYTACDHFLVPTELNKLFEDIEYLIEEELDEFAEKVSKLVKKATQSQFDAIVSFAYNVGVAALASSTLLKKHNAGDYAEAQKQFLRWDKAAGKTLPGLTKRRIHESALYGK